jgi:peptide-methionine (R)-S-oxide reductase
MKRRRAAIAIAVGLAVVPFARPVRAAESFEIVRSDETWLRLLGAERYRVLRRRGTEYPGTSALLSEHRHGIFACAGCDLALFSSDAKFESGTGWPSFTAPLRNAVRTSSDRGLLEERTEVHCRRCGGHLGHVFADGPKPAGLRYCMNGIALTFHPSALAS